MGDYKLINHTGDIGIFVEGRNLKDLFSTAASGMSSQIIKTSKIRKRLKKKIVLDGENIEDLLVRWLNELLYLSEKGYFFKDFKIEKIQEKILSASIWGEKIDSTRLSLYQEIKAATYHQLEIKKNNDKWQATIIFDV